MRWKSGPYIPGSLGPMGSATSVWEGFVNQVSRIIMNGSAGSPDEQAAAPDEQGGYGAIMDEIDRLLDETDQPG